jgi:hypothetical protein
VTLDRTRLARALAILALVVPLLIEATAQRVVATPSVLDEALAATDAQHVAFRHNDIRPDDLLTRVLAPTPTIFAPQQSKPPFHPTNGRDPTWLPVPHRAGARLVSRLPRPPGNFVVH